MNEDKVTNFLKKFIESVNDMRTPVFEKYKKKFINENSAILNKYVSKKLKWEIQIRDLISKYLYSVNGIFFKKGVNYSFCRIKLGRGNVLVPLEFTCMMETILTKSLKVSGLFRRSTTGTNLQHCHQLIVNCQKKSLYRLYMINNLLQFDLITLTSVYKQLFDQFPSPLIPNWYLELIFKISDIESASEKITLLKYIIYTIPKPNRNMLDSITQFCSLIYRLVDDPSENIATNMDIHGFVVVMMPKIFIKPDTKVDLNDINKLIEVLEFIFVNRLVLFSVGKQKNMVNNKYITEFFDTGTQPNIQHTTESKSTGF